MKSLQRMFPSTLQATRLTTLIACFFVVLILGCGDDGSKKKSADNKNDEGKKSSKSEGKTDKKNKNKKSKSGKGSSTIVKKSFTSSNKNKGFATSRIGNKTDRQVDLSAAILEFAAETQKTNPTVVIWLFDVSKSSTTLREKIQSGIKTYKPAGKPFESVIGTFGNGPVDFLIDVPTDDFDLVKKKIDEIPKGGAEGEKTFSAINECLDKFGPLRRSERKSLMLVVITDEAGDDAAEIADGKPQAENALKKLDKFAIPLFVIGSPSPFGRSIDAVQAMQKDLTYGPETAFAERVSLGMWDGSTAIHRFDSGYGPWQLERLCRASGGRFLADRPSTRSMRLMGGMQSNWPGVISKVFEDSVMSKYKPFYGTVADYKAQLDASKAKMALHQAAKVSYKQVFRVQNYEFRVGNEAQLVREINAAQRGPAIIRPGLEELYGILRVGEKDRDSLEGARWQASFDLAYGRVMANYVRVVGLNSMLAELKGGKNFQNEGSNRWVLEPSDEVSSGSTNRKMADKATLYLQRIVKEHAGTPWAEIAARELESPMGWKWTEAQR